MIKLAKIDNKIVKVKVIDSKYNDHASEVIMLESKWKGIMVIVENKDFIEPNTYNELVKFIKSYIDIKELDEHHFVELIDIDIFKIISGFAIKYKLTKSEYHKLISVYSDYNTCTTIEEVKTNIMIDSIQKNLEGLKCSFTKIKKETLIKIKLK